MSAARAAPKMASHTLPFVGRSSKEPGRLCFWYGVRSTGDLEQDQKLGSQYAWLALRAIKADNFTPLLGMIACDMVRNRCPQDIAVGFWQTVSDVCMRVYEI